MYYSNTKCIREKTFIQKLYFYELFYFKEFIFIKCGNNIKDIGMDRKFMLSFN
jgi:hypothetical protein